VDQRVVSGLLRTVTKEGQRVTIELELPSREDRGWQERRINELQGMMEGQCVDVQLTCYTPQPVRQS